MSQAAKTLGLLAALLLGLVLVPASAPVDARPSARLVPLWHADIPMTGEGYEHALTSRDFLVRTARGVLALGVDDGHPRWRHQLTTASATGWDLASDVVLIDYYRPLTRADSRHELIAVSGVTGKELWRRPRTSLPPGWRRPPAARSRVFAVKDLEAGTIKGISTGTGRDVWSFGVPAGCDVSGSAARATDVVLLLACGRSPRVLLLDAATGTTLRSIPLPAGTSPEFQVADGVIAVFGDRTMTLFDDRGRPVLHHGECWPQCAMARGPGLVLTSYHSGRDDVLAATSWPGGAPLWQVRPAPTYAKLVEGGIGARAGIGGFPVVDSIDPGTGAATSYTLPAPATVLASAGQRLYAGSALRAAGQTHRVRVSALRRVPPGRGPSLLGGVDPGRWPDACALPPGGTFSPGTPRNTLYGYTLPRPVTCRYTERGGGSLNVRVLWVADDPNEAAAMIDTLGDAYASTPAAGIGDQAVVGGSLPIDVYFRVGPVVAAVESGDLPVRRRLTALAGSVADRLRDAGPGVRTRPTLPATLPAAPSRRLELSRLPGTEVTVAQDVTAPPVVIAYLLDGHPYVRAKGTFTRLGEKVDALSPDGAWGARTAKSYPSRGRDPVTILDTAKRSVRRIPTVEAPMGVASPVWSPDGRTLLLTATDRGTITGFVVVDLATMRPRFVRVADGGRYSGRFRWGGDAGTVAVQSGPLSDYEDADDDFDVTFFDLDGTVKRRLENVGKLIDGQNWASPSGLLFATRCPERASQTCLWRTSDGTRTAQIPFEPGAFVSWYDDARFLGWHRLTPEEQALAVTDFPGRPFTHLARAHGHDGLTLVTGHAPS
ncbi:PQQ-binding-like beta-propeller repeat protein [Nonomuraea sp. NPDC050153]|uniref:outer membrane protein assembly factor BamB family protein n=1 Tax=Nonomuraea sp. NPDC050153 TaxID=3364359 RepID=UPI003795AA59